jgi:hypothetical protein
MYIAVLILGAVLLAAIVREDLGAGYAMQPSELA